MLPDTAGAAAFPQMQYNGGSVGGIPVIACDEMTDGEILLVDATQVAAVAEPLVSACLRRGFVQMDDVGDSPPSGSTTIQSLWQLGWATIKIERYIAIKLLRSRRRHEFWRKFHRRKSGMNVIVGQLTPDEREQATRAVVDRHRGKDLPTIIASLHLELIGHLSALEERISQLERKKR